MTEKSIELVKILKKRKVSIACVEETKWTGAKAKDIDEYKLWYTGVAKSRNGVSIIGDSDLRDQVVEVRKVNDRIMAIKLVVGGAPTIVISTYAPQAGLDEEVKRRFWEDLDELVRGFPQTERMFIGVDFNGHIGRSKDEKLRMEVILMRLETVARSSCLSFH